MSNFIEVGKASDFKEGTIKHVTAGGREILVARVGDNFYAADDRCPHMGAKLSRGKLEGTAITCPLHLSQFDLQDGRVLRWAVQSSSISLMVRSMASTPHPLRTYKVKVEGDSILVSI